MKNIRTSILLLATAWTFAACSNDSFENLQPASDDAEKTVTVRLCAENSIEEDTKASLTPDDAETTFSAAWEPNDCLGLYTTYNGSTKKASNSPMIYDGRYFTGTLKTQEGATTWNYYAYYPYQSSSSAIPFGDSRTQRGNTFNGAYDLMTGAAESVDNDLPGLDAEGNPIVIPMHRQTAILYFHLTTEEAWAATEKVTRVELAADKYISGTAKFSDSQHAFSIESANRRNNISLTFDEGTAPTAADLKAYFNIFTASSNIKLNLTVYTEGHKLAISKGSATYTAGKLYRIAKSVPGTAWMVYNPGPLPAPELSDEAEYVSAAAKKITVKWPAVANATGYAYRYEHPVTNETVEGTSAAANPSVTIDGLTPETNYTFTLYVKALGDGADYQDSPESVQTYTNIATTAEPVGGQTYVWDFTQLIATPGNITEAQIFVNNGKELVFVPGGSSKSTKSSGQIFVQLGGKSTIKSKIVTERYWYFTASGSGTLKITFCSNSASKTTDVIVMNTADTSAEGATLGTHSVTGSTAETCEYDLNISGETTLYIYATNETRYYKFEWTE